MSKSTVRYWFGARPKGRGRMYHVISAVSIEVAEESMGALAKNYVFEQLTWSDIMLLTGCAPPTAAPDKTLASGPIMLGWMDKVISFEVAD